MFIGKRLRALRKEKGLKLKELAQKSGVQIATLSRIEHNKMTGTLDSHMAIARALDVELPSLYTDIVKPKTRVELNTDSSENAIFVHNEKASHQILTTNVLKKKMMPSLLRLEPGGRTAPEVLKPGTERFVYALASASTVVINGEPYTLAENSSMYFDAAQKHVFENPALNESKLLILTTPSQF